MSCAWRCDGLDIDFIIRVMNVQCAKTAYIVEVSITDNHVVSLSSLTNTVITC